LVLEKERGEEEIERGEYVSMEDVV